MTSFCKKFHSAFDSETPKIIRIFTILAYISSLTAFFVYTRNAFIKWNSDPDIAQKGQLIPSTEIPAPAITICPPNAFKSGFINYTDYYLRQKDPVEKFKINLSVSQQNYLAATIQICAPNAAKIALDYTRNRNETDPVKLLDQSAFNLDEIFLACIYKSIYGDCKKFFNKVITDDGICFSFNMQGFNEIFHPTAISQDFNYFKRKSIAKSLESDELKNISINDSTSHIEHHWTLQNSYTSSDEEIPYRAIPTLDIKFVTKLNFSDSFDMCMIRREGYKLIYHLPNEIPTIFHDYDFFDFGLKSINIITAQRSKSDASLRKYSIESRRCFFENERKLKFFKSYTKAHCNLECLANFTFRECGCVKFSMPRAPDTPVCDLNKVSCFLKAYSSWPKFDVNSNKSVMPCNCYPPCTDIKYSVKYKTTSILSGKTSMTLRKLKGNADDKIFAYYQIKFNDFQYDEVESFVTYLLQNFIADCGGLLGLFMGISLLSLINSILKFSKKFMLQKKIEIEKSQLKEVLVCETCKGKSSDRPTTPLSSVDCEYRDLGIKNIPWVESKNI